MDLHSLTQLDVATAVGVDRSTVSHWLNYGEIPGTASLIGLSQLFGVAKEDVFELAGVALPDAPAKRRLAPDTIYVPVVESFNETESKELIAWVPDHMLESDQVIAVRAVNDILSPVVMVGDVVILDRQRAPVLGDIVALSGRDGRPELWRLGREGALWVIMDADGRQRSPLRRDDLCGVYLASIRPRRAFTWPNGA